MIIKLLRFIRLSFNTDYANILYIFFPKDRVHLNVTFSTVIFIVTGYILRQMVNFLIIYAEDQSTKKMTKSSQVHYYLYSAKWHDKVQAFAERASLSNTLYPIYFLFLSKKRKHLFEWRLSFWVDLRWTKPDHPQVTPLCFTSPHPPTLRLLQYIS